MNPLTLVARAMPGLATAALAPHAAAQGVLYVSHQNDGNVWVIDTSTNAHVDTIPIGSLPQDLAILPNGSKLYAVNAGSDTVSVIDTALRTVVTVSVGVNPIGMAVHPGGAVGYVTNFGANSISVIDTAGDTVVDTVPVGAGPVGIDINPDGTRLYVSNRVDNTITVIDTATNTVIDAVPVGEFPIQMGIDPNGALVYVPNGLGDTLSVIYEPTRAVLATVPTGAFPLMVAIHPSRRGVAYVTHSGGDTIGVIDLARNASIGSITVDPGPWGLSFDTAGEMLYANSFDSDSVAVIDTATRTVVHTIAVGDGPVDVLVAPTAECPGDFNGDGRLNVFDFLAFQTAFGSGC